MRNTPVIPVRTVERAYLGNALRRLMAAVDSAFEEARECDMPDTMAVMFCVMDDLSRRLTAIERAEPELMVEQGGGEGDDVGQAPTMIVTPGDEPTPPPTPVAIRRIRHG